jgi:anti-anti-sigma factor
MDDEAVFWVEARIDDAASLIVLTGELDLAAVPLVEEQLHRAARPEAGAITIDLSGVTFCDLAGMRVLERARATGAILVGRSDPAVLRLHDLAEHLRPLPHEQDVRPVKKVLRRDTSSGERKTWRHVAPAWTALRGKVRL